MRNILYIYQKAINDIDDYYEYRYAHQTQEENKDFVLSVIDQLLNELKEITKFRPSGE